MPQLGWPSFKRVAAARFVARLRGRHLVVIDILATIVASYIALAFRYDSALSLDAIVPFVPILAILVAARFALQPAVRSVQPRLAVRERSRP